MGCKAIKADGANFQRSGVFIYDIRARFHKMGGVTCMIDEFLSRYLGRWQGKGPRDFQFRSSMSIAGVDFAGMSKVRYLNILQQILNMCAGF
jgi:hypothetical protein